MVTDEGRGPLLEAHGLVKSYGGFTLDGVSLAVEPGSVVGLVGTNGAGKTTLIKALLGLVRPDAGTARLLGSDAGAASGVHGRVGVVFDGVSFPGELRVRDVRRAMRASFDAWDDGVFDGYLDRFGLDGRRRVRELSRGMGMELMLACALSHGADLLVLDEATAGLDPMAREEVLDILRGFMAQDERRGVLLATHITSDLEHVADYVACLDGGRLVFSLEKDQISEVAGIARLHEAEFGRLCADGALVGARYVRNEMSVDVLVPDRRAFARAYPHVVLDRANIESYMALMLRGELVHAPQTSECREA